MEHVLNSSVRIWFGILFSAYIGYGVHLHVVYDDIPKIVDMITNKPTNDNQ